MELLSYLANLFQHKTKLAIGLVLICSVAVAGTLIDNILISGNTISTLNTDGNLTLDMNGSGRVLFADLTATTVPYLDASKLLQSSSVTPTELGYLGSVTSSLCGINQSCTLTNKTLTSPIIATISNTGTLTLPTSTDTLVGRATTDTLENKTINGSSNTLSNIAYSSLVLSGGVVNADINSTAAIARSKIANGTADYVIINDGSGTLSSEATLAITRGGTGQATAQAAIDSLLPTQGSSSGQFLTTDGTNASWGTPAGSTNYSSSQDLKNYSLAWSVGSSALTIGLKSQDGGDCASADPCQIAFPNGSGGYSVISQEAALSITVPSTATLGHTSAIADMIYVYLINDAGTLDICVSTQEFDDQTSQSPTAVDTSADSRSVMYCGSGHTTKYIRTIGFGSSTQATAGTWDSVPTSLKLAPNTSNLYISSFVGKTGMDIVFIDCDGSSTIENNRGNWVSSIGNISGGNCTLTLKTGYFSEAPLCMATAQGPSSAIGHAFRANGASATSVTVDCRATSDVDCGSYTAVVVCWGTR